MESTQMQTASVDSIRQMLGGMQEMFAGMKDVEADSGGETEAGTTQRDVVRLSVVNIPVSFSVSPKWLKALTGFKQREKISVDYFDTQTLEIKKTEMYIEGYKANLVKDTSYKGLWKVSFILREF